MKLLTLLLILVIIPLVVAIPELPHRFYGTVSNANGLVSSGTLTAKLDNKLFTTQIVNGNYGLSSPFLVHREDSSATNIEFYIDGHKVYDFTYQAGAYTQLNLVIPIFSISINDTDNNITSDDDEDDRHNDNDREDMIIVAPVIPQDTNEPPSTPSVDTNKETVEESSFKNFFVSLKNTAGNMVSIPFETVGSSIISSFVIAYLVIFAFLYWITGKNFIFKPKETLRRAKLIISYWGYFKNI